MNKKLRPKERKYQIDDSTVELLEGNIIFCVGIGEQTAKMSLAYVEAVDQFFSMAEGDMYFLIDLNQCGKNSPEARQTWKMFTERKRTRKVALYGLHPVAKVLASFYMGITHKKNQRFFKTKEKALAWLNEPST